MLYKATVDNGLEFIVNPAKPKRGQSAFQTDICIFDESDPEKPIPRIVIETKVKGFSTHDLLTYSAKARKHKEIYPYLRYGFLVCDNRPIPTKFFVHNESLDFCVMVLPENERILKRRLKCLIIGQLEASHHLEQRAFGRPSVFLFQNRIEMQ